jgi:hypothetical protein
MYCAFVDERGVNIYPRPLASPLWTGKSSRDLGRTQESAITDWGRGEGATDGFQKPAHAPGRCRSSGINTQAPPDGTFGLQRASARRPLPRVRRSGIESREAPVAQLDRALPSEGRGHRFESCRARHKAVQIVFEIYFDPPSSRRASTRCWFSSGVPMLIRSLSRKPSSLNHRTKMRRAIRDR